MKNHLLAAGLALAASALGAAPLSEDDFIESMIGEMTLEEKVGQLVQRGALKGWVDPVAGDATRNPLNEELLADIREGRVGALEQCRGHLCSLSS